MLHINIIIYIYILRCELCSSHSYHSLRKALDHMVEHFKKIFNYEMNLELLDGKKKKEEFLQQLQQVSWTIISWVSQEPLVECLKNLSF